MAEQREAVAKERLTRERNREIEQVRYNMDLRIRGMQNQFKLWAVMLPPIPPLLVALVVFTLRRLKEREGVSKRRLR